ncbi:MAG: transglutaminase-like cysteine peptidase [Caulobacteraceae bacterium]
MTAALKPMLAAMALAALASCAGTTTDTGFSADSFRAPAPTETPAKANFMQLGQAAAPPLGYLDFCARRPDQCGLAPTPGEDMLTRQHALYAKYFWPFAFKGAGPTTASLTPTSGGGALAPKPAAVKFDWSAIFPATGAAPAPSAARAPAERPAAAPVSMTPALMRTVADVNERVNRSILYVSDEALYGVKDYWTLPLSPGGPAAGDCKDYVLEKRRALAADGIPVADLSIAIVRTARGETHAVLLLTTDRGELVLDSLTSEIRPWRKVRYAWLERQRPGRPLAWAVVLPPRTVS